MRTLIVTAAVVLLASSGLSAQRDVALTSGSAVVSGVVTTGVDSPQPVRRATVTLTGSGVAGSRVVVTDDRGRFVFDALPVGRYLLMAEKPAFVVTHFGSPTPGRGPGRVLALGDGQRVDVSVRLVRGAVLEGVVRDERGRPLSTSQIQLSRPIVVAGETRWVAAPTGRIVATDEQGRYRIWGLPPGEYIVRASGPSGFGNIVPTTPETVAAALKDADGRSRGLPSTPAMVASRAAFSPTFAPSTVDRASAQRFVLKEGQEWTGADVTVRLERSARVSMVALGPNGERLSNVSVAIVNTRDRTTWASAGFVRPSEDGRFAVPSMQAGDYAFVGTAAAPPAPGAAATVWHTDTRFSVFGDDITDLPVSFLPGATVRGTVTVAEGAAITAGTKVVLTNLDAIRGASPATLTAMTTADGRFNFESVPPGRVRVSVADTGTWSLASAHVGDTEVSDAPFTVASGAVLEVGVTLTSRPTVLSGALQDALGRPAPEYAVVVFSVDRTQWGATVRRESGLVRLDSEARFRVVGLPPGDYYLAAVTDVEPQQLTDPGFLETLVDQSVRVSLSAGQQLTQRLQLSGG